MSCRAHSREGRLGNVRKEEAITELDEWRIGGCSVRRNPYDGVGQRDSRARIIESRANDGRITIAGDVAADVARRVQRTPDLACRRSREMPSIALGERVARLESIDGIDTLPTA